MDQFDLTFRPIFDWRRQNSIGDDKFCIARHTTLEATEPLRLPSQDVLAMGWRPGALARPDEAEAVVGPAAVAQRADRLRS